jgi:BolA protein
MKTRKEQIQSILNKKLSPTHLRIEDRTHLHAGHGSILKGSLETHFFIEINSKLFENKSILEQHRMVMDPLQPMMKEGLHSVEIYTKS